MAKKIEIRKFNVKSNTEQHGLIQEKSEKVARSQYRDCNPQAHQEAYKKQ